MKRFKFKFAVVLQVRKAHESETLRLLTITQRKHQETIANKQKWIQELAKSLKRKENLGATTQSIVAYQGEQDYIQGVKQRIIQADHAIIRANREVQKALRVYLIARKQTKALEVLQEKDYLEYKKERAKHEQKELDDLMVMRTRLKEESA